jgi:hypothetical protein
MVSERINALDDLFACAAVDLPVRRRRAMHIGTESDIFFASQVRTDASARGPVRSDLLQQLQEQFGASEISFARHLPLAAPVRA